MTDGKTMIPMPTLIPKATRMVDAAESIRSQRMFLANDDRLNRVDPQVETARRQFGKFLEATKTGHLTLQVTGKPIEGITHVGIHITPQPKGKGITKRVAGARIRASAHRIIAIAKPR